jgi:hypothetical protein
MHCRLVESPINHDTELDDGFGAPDAPTVLLASRIKERVDPKTRYVTQEPAKGHAVEGEDVYMCDVFPNGTYGESTSPSQKEIYWMLMWFGVPRSLIEFRGGLLRAELVTLLREVIVPWHTRGMCVCVCACVLVYRFLCLVEFRGGLLRAELVTVLREVIVPWQEVYVCVCACLYIHKVLTLLRKVIVPWHTKGMCVYMNIYLCVCICVCVHVHICTLQTHTHTCTHKTGDRFECK